MLRAGLLEDHRLARPLRVPLEQGERRLHVVGILTHLLVMVRVRVRVRVPRPVRQRTDGTDPSPNLIPTPSPTPSPNPTPSLVVQPPVEYDDVRSGHGCLYLVHHHRGHPAVPG